jgi:ankyrin repeat protein
MATWGLVISDAHTHTLSLLSHALTHTTLSHAYCLSHTTQSHAQLTTHSHMYRSHAGVDVNLHRGSLEDNEDGYIALHKATLAGESVAVDLLLDYNADVNAKTGKGEL